MKSEYLRGAQSADIWGPKCKDSHELNRYSSPGIHAPNPQELRTPQHETLSHDT